MGETIDPTASELKGSILFVCSGNVCRSPIAAALLRGYLEEWPVEVQSAGLIARDGLPVEPKMVKAVQGLGVQTPDLTEFRSQRLTADLLEQADLVVTATRSQRADVVRAAPSTVRTAFTVKEFAALVSDVVAMLERNGEAKPHTVADVVALVPLVRGMRVKSGSPDIMDPMGRSSRTHVRATREIAASVEEIARGLRP
ncbi:arsenate reductase/protein-tyrosine-phosphatase family protein [Terracoccus luteus]|uniref:Protein-tyrosine phosphatase n=1 Tax=Terracoccus luteus TaxID=53356 RepID=A0A839PZA2_9MICO|nr:hypothetical protein [Terracoccus luteus]MBB2985721.1 protein-tyrosine phosphatase [Terracoccus luteus]MCP2171373.1 protein-tyrosine phosphatase [Terracoccus luteus]